ncbi:MAG: prenyltransferase [Alkalicoccus sp.]|nr:MAG: prenyltransferase [Alkalicoccus sp.]
MTVLNAGFIKKWSMLFRSAAVISSSAAAVLSSMLPLLFHTDLTPGYLALLFIMLITAAFAVHGVLTHAFNDYTDYKSGTDQWSPALLSGGSRVLQTGAMKPEGLKKIGVLLASVLLALAAVFIIAGRIETAVLLTVGVWGAYSYSMPPLRLSYRPFFGEWFSLFPSILLLGTAAPWIALGTIPVWAWQNGLVNALFCLAWVMIHHIPDIKADKRAEPAKKTTVVWAVQKFGYSASRFPASGYLLLTVIPISWMVWDRPAAAFGAMSAVTVSFFLIRNIDPKNVHEVTDCEKKLLLLAVFTALWLGIFV